MSLSIEQNGFCVVLGLGKTGESVIKYLHQKKIKICGMDTRSSPPGITRLKNLLVTCFFVLVK